MSEPPATMAESPNSRLETFFDGVFAIAITLALGATYRKARV